ncbi:MAG: hypothetical protein AB8I80_17805, partial [Anaerolineae bacterium]
MPIHCLKIGRWIIATLLAFAVLLAISTVIQSPVATAGPAPKPVNQVGPLSPGPDLIIESITLDPAEPGVDQAFDINVKVKNQ